MSMATSVLNLGIWGVRFGNMRDVADFTASLTSWVEDLLPGFKARPASSRAGSPESSAPAENVVLLKLASAAALNSPRSHETVTSRLKLRYRFEVLASDPADEQQAIADLAFGLLERDDCADEHIQSDGPSVAAAFVLERTRALRRAKPVRKAIFDLRANVQVRGRVQSENRTPLPRATLHVHGSDKLVIADEHGGFTFAAPQGAILHATVKAKGKTMDVELQPERANLITLAMES